MPTMLTMALTLVVGLTSSDAAAADDEAREEAVEIDAATGRKIQWKERTEIIFDGVSVDGEIVRPQTKLVGERRPPVFHPLIELRKDWAPEMRTSLDAVK
jgi:hypothetical protein